MNSQEKFNVFNYLKTLESQTQNFNNKSCKNLCDDNLSENETIAGNENSGKIINNTNEEDYFKCASFNYFKNSTLGSSKFSLSECDIDNNYDRHEKKFNYISKNKFLPDDFEKLDELGEGAYAEVLKVRHKTSNEIYAIKVIDKTLIEREGKLFQIYIENEFLNNLSHPNIIKIFGVFEDDDKINLVLEYGCNGTLSKFIQKSSGNIDNNIMILYAAQMISVVEYLSTKNIVHRDIKPENFVLDANYNLKLIDFATACYPDKFYDEENNRYITEDEFNRLTDDKKFKILKNQICQGTPNYMPPEVINNNHKIGIYSDLWSVGCILYDMTFGSPPFMDKTDYLVFQNIINLNYNFPNDIKISPKLKDLIKGLLKLNPLDRISSDGNFELFKNHSFFSDFNQNTIIDDLKNAFKPVKFKRFISEQRTLDCRICLPLKHPSKFFNKNSDKANTYINTYDSNKKESDDKNSYINAYLDEAIPDYDDIDNRLENIEKEDLDEHKEFFPPIDTVIVRHTRNFSEKNLTLKSKTINFDFNYNKTINPCIENFENKIKNNMGNRFSNHNNNLMNTNINNKNSIKRNNDSILNNQNSNEIILKIGNLKMLSHWMFWDNRKIIFYKNLNFEYFEMDKNELKGKIQITIDFKAVMKNENQFDLISSEKTYSFFSKKEGEISNWVDLINKNIEQHSRKGCILKK